MAGNGVASETFVERSRHHVVWHDEVAGDIDPCAVTVCESRGENCGRNQEMIAGGKMFRILAREEDNTRAVSRLAARKRVLVFTRFTVLIVHTICCANCRGVACES